MSSGPDLSVILVTWNVRELVLNCIQCVFQRQGELEVEVILVDNGSSDGTLEAVQEGFPLVRIVQNHENLGFPRANNLAATCSFSIPTRRSEMTRSWPASGNWTRTPPLVPSGAEFCFRTDEFRLNLPDDIIGSWISFGRLSISMCSFPTAGSLRTR